LLKLLFIPKNSKSIMAEYPNAPPPNVQLGLSGIRTGISATRLKFSIFFLEILSLRRGGRSFLLFFLLDQKEAKSQVGRNSTAPPRPHRLPTLPPTGNVALYKTKNKNRCAFF